MVIPALAAPDALDQRSLDTIAADHAWIDQILSDLGDALGVLAFGLGGRTGGSARPPTSPGRRRHVLSDQLACEQRLLGPLVDRWFAPDEREIVRHEVPDAARRHWVARFLPRLAVLPRGRLDPHAAQRQRRRRAG